MTVATSRRKEQTEADPGVSTRRVVLGVAISLDGHIARRDGSVDWLREPRFIDPEIDLGSYAKTFDVVIAGRKTLDLPDAKSSGANPMGKMACYIFSRSKPPGRRGGAEYVSQAPSELIRELKARPGRDIWLMGGGELAREFLKEDLIDRLDLSIMPVLLGEGIPLFPHGFPQRDFVLEKFQSYKSGIVRATYVRAFRKGDSKT